MTSIYQRQNMFLVYQRPDMLLLYQRQDNVKGTRQDKLNSQYIE